MKTMTNYPRVVLRALASAGAATGLVAALTTAVSAAPTAPVTITERNAAKPAPATSVALAAVRQTAKPQKLAPDTRPLPFILQTAARRLRGTTGRPAKGTVAGVHVARTGTAPKPAQQLKSKATVTAARPGNGVKTCVRLVAANGDATALPTGGAGYGNLKTAPPASDRRIREFGNAGQKGTFRLGSRTLKVGESQVLAFRWVNRVAIGNPAVADVVAISDNQVLVNGKTVGETNLFVWDTEGQHEYKVAVIEGAFDMGEIARLVSRDLGREDIQVRPFGHTLFLLGQVKTPAEQQLAEAVASAYTKDVKNFIQLVQNGAAPDHASATDVAASLNQVFSGGPIRARALNDGNTVVLEGNVVGDMADQARHVAAALAKGVTVIDYFQAASSGLRQVLVHSRVVDIDKVKSRELGIDWGPVLQTAGAGGIVQRIVGEQPFNFGEARTGPFKLDQGGPLSRLDPIGFKLRALENQNAARTLSEPNLLVMEGHKGGILIGGEIPIPVAQQAGSGVGTSITVEYKPFGIRLDVEVLGLTDDWVTMRISPEVSSLDYTNAVTVNGFNLPALRTRRADSVVRIKNGQTLAIGGLLQNDINKQTKAIPLLSKIPILGQLFKDTRFLKGESELVILVTPELPGPDNTVSTPIPNVKMERPDPNVKAR